MKIIILGAGQVGVSVAESLVSEANDITVVDFDGERLANLQERLDLRVAKRFVLSQASLELSGTLQQRLDDEPTSKPDNRFDSRHLLYFSAELEF